MSPARARQTVRRPNRGRRGKARGGDEYARLERLRRLDAGSVSDALDRLGLEGAAPGIHRLSTQATVVGRVSTVELRLAPGGEHATSDAPRRHLGVEAIRTAGPKTVVVVDNRGRLDVAAWGGLLSAAARGRNIEGVIIDGATRDLDEIRRMRFPVFARGAVPITARGRVEETATGGPVVIRGVSVRSNDLVIADGSGVVFIPRERIDETLAVAEEIERRERRLRAAIVRGEPIEAVLGESYERMLAHDR